MKCEMKRNNDKKMINNMNENDNMNEEVIIMIWNNEEIVMKWNNERKWKRNEWKWRKW